MRKYVALILLLSLTLNIFSSFLLMPQKAEASGPVVDVWNVGLKTITKIGINIAVNAAIGTITRSITNWANSGFEGKPAFAQNFNKELKFATDKATEDVLNGLIIKGVNVGGFLCGPFSQEIRNAFRIQLAVQRADSPLQPSCTVEKILKEAGYTLKNFEEDFNQGGWPAWLEMTTAPGGNRYFAYLSIQQEIWKKKAETATDRNQQLEYGSGILSQKKKGECTQTLEDAIAKAEEALAQAETDEERAQISEAESALADVADAEGCLSRGPSTIVTPGQTIQTQLSKALGLPEDRLVAAKEINEMISAVLTNFMKKVFTTASGLFGATGPGGYNEQMEKDLSDEAERERERAAGEAEKVQEQLDLNNKLGLKERELQICLAELAALEQQFSCESQPDGTMKCEVKYQQNQYNEQKQKCDDISQEIKDIKDRILELMTEEVSDMTGGEEEAEGPYPWQCLYYGTTPAPASKTAEINEAGPYLASKTDIFSGPQLIFPAEVGKFYEKLNVDFDLYVQDLDHLSLGEWGTFLGFGRRKGSQFLSYWNIGSRFGTKLFIDTIAIGDYFKNQSGFNLTADTNYHISVQYSAKDNGMSIAVKNLSTGIALGTWSFGNVLPAPDIYQDGTGLMLLLPQVMGWKHSNIKAVLTPGGPYRGGVAGVCGMPGQTGDVPLP